VAVSKLIVFGLVVAALGAILVWRNIGFAIKRRRAEPDEHDSFHDRIG
jgi:hypothetical protein